MDFLRFLPFALIWAVLHDILRRYCNATGGESTSLSEHRLFQ